MSAAQAGRAEGRTAPKIALFMGAGASTAYGMPTTKELRDELYPDFPRQDLLDDDRFPDAEHILQALDDEAAFMGTAAGAHHRGDNPILDGRMQDTERAREFLEDLVRSSYAWRQSFLTMAVGEVLGPLFGLAESPGGDVAVFTTNYDPAVEEYCADTERRAECIDGFELHKASRQYVWTGRFAPGDRAALRRIYLYKLHGSMNWQRATVDDTPAVIKKPSDSVPADRADDAYIRPTLNVKDKDVRAEPFATIMDKLNSLLPTFDACVVIGCSFRDEHIRRMFARFIRGGNTLVAVGPEAAYDFCAALGMRPDPSQKSQWGAVPVCSMAYRQGEADRFYAVHARIDVRSAGAIADSIRSILSKPAGSVRLGFMTGAGAIGGRGVGGGGGGAVAGGGGRGGGGVPPYA